MERRNNSTGLWGLGSDDPSTMPCRKVLLYFPRDRINKGRVRSPCATCPLLAILHGDEEKIGRSCGHLQATRGAIPEEEEIFQSLHSELPLRASSGTFRLLFRNQGRGKDNDSLTMLHSLARIGLSPHSCLHLRACTRSIHLTGRHMDFEFLFDRDVNLLLLYRLIFRFGEHSGEKEIEGEKSQ